MLPVHRGERISRLSSVACSCQRIVRSGAPSQAQFAHSACSLRTSALGSRLRCPHLLTLQVDRVWNQTSSMDRFHRRLHRRCTCGRRSRSGSSRCQDLPQTLRELFEKQYMSPRSVKYDISVHWSRLVPGFSLHCHNGELRWTAALQPICWTVVMTSLTKQHCRWRSRLCWLCRHRFEHFLHSQALAKIATLSP